MQAWLRHAKKRHTSKQSEDLLPSSSLQSSMFGFSGSHGFVLRVASRFIV